MIEPGTLLLGKYRIERVIGEGGMGVVALAHHVQLDQPVAIKFLLPQVLDNAEVVQRFLREAQAAVKLRSEHVARVHDVGSLETGAPYMVMEYLDGTDLDQLLAQQGALAPGLAVDFMLQACEALAEAHALGIVHRDIKPANFFITRRASGAPLLKVLDFGISKSSVAMDEGITSTQAIMGTPAYMSPEQMRSTKHVDARTDIWALGVVLYEALSGQRPFTGETFSALCLKVAMDPTPILSMPLPAGLADVVARCMEKELEARFQNVAELAMALAPYAQTHAQAASTTARTAGVLGLAAGRPHTAPGTGATGMRAPSTGVGAPVATPPTTMGASSGELARASGRGPRLGLILGTAGAVLAAAAVALLLAGGSGDEAGPAAPDPTTATPEVVPAAQPAAAPAAADTVTAGETGTRVQPDAGVAAAAEDTRVGAAETQTAGAGTAGSEEADQADEARDDSSSRRDRRRRSSRSKRDERARTRRKSPGQGEKRPTRTKGGDLDDLFDSRQ